MLSLVNNILSSSAVLGFSSTKSVLLDGTNDFMTPGDFLDRGTNDFSVSMWFKEPSDASTSGATKYLFSKLEDSNNLIRLFLSSSNNKLFLDLIGGSTVVSNINGATAVDNIRDQWNHVLLSVDRDGDVNLYVNGSNSGHGTSGSAANSSQTLNNTAPWRFGSRASGNDSLGGGVDEVAIYNAALSSDDAVKLYNSGKPTDLSLSASYDTDRTSNLEAWWRMGDGTNDNASVIHDANNPGFDANLAEGDNSDFDTVGNWSGAGATVAGGYDSGDTDHSTTLRIQADGTTNSRAELAQSNLRTTTVANKVYLVTFDFKWINTTGITSDPFVTIGGTLKANIDRTATGWTAYSAHFTAADNSTAIRIYVQTGSSGHADNEILIDNFVIKPLKGFPGTLTNGPTIQTDAP